MKQLLLILLFVLSMQVSADTIEGAFGLKLGDTVPQGLVFEPVEGTRNTFYFKPKKPIQMYDTYTFEMSPIGKKVVYIMASKDCDKSEIDKHYVDLLNLLTFKYGVHGSNTVHTAKSIAADIFSANVMFHSGTKNIYLKGCMYDRAKGSLQYIDNAIDSESKQEQLKQISDKYNEFDL